MILVTGSTGHLGANLVRRLLADGQVVRVLLRSGSDNTSLDVLDVERVHGDLRDHRVRAPASVAVQVRHVSDADGVPRTADAVAAELGVARERVRQIELHSLRKLGAHVMPVPEAA